MIWLRRVGRLLGWILAIFGLAVLVIGALLVVPVVAPPPIESIRAGALAVDQSGRPELSRFQARDGTALAYRLYPAAGGDTRRMVIVIHGSAGHSTGVNEIAKRLAADNVTVVAPDIRGHGGSGTRGDIAYDGQLDDDLDDLLAHLRERYQTPQFTLVGFSSGGGFALREADRFPTAFDRLVLLSPYLGHDAASTRGTDTAPRWAGVDIPRLIALSLLHGFGVPCCEGLPVIAFALAPGSEKYVTARYSYRLLTNFGPPGDLAGAFRRLKTPATIIAGSADELMLADKYADVVQGIDPVIDVRLLPGLRHMDMMHAPAALDATSAAVTAK